MARHIGDSPDEQARIDIWRINNILWLRVCEQSIPDDALVVSFHRSKADAVAGRKAIRGWQYAEVLEAMAAVAELGGRQEWHRC